MKFCQFINLPFLFAFADANKTTKLRNRTDFFNGFLDTSDFRMFNAYFLSFSFHLFLVYGIMP